MCLWSHPLLILAFSISDPRRKTVSLIVDAALRSYKERYQNGLPMFRVLRDISALLTFHPPVSLFKIQTAVYCSANRAAYVVLHNGPTPPFRVAC